MCKSTLNRTILFYICNLMSLLSYISLWCCIFYMPLFQVLWKLKAQSVNVGNFAVPLQCATFGSKRRTKFYKTIRGAGETLLSSSILQTSWGLKKIHVWYVPSPFSFGNLVGVHAKIQTLISRKKELKHNICIFFTRVVIIAMLVITLSVTINKSPACEYLVNLSPLSDASQV